MWTYGGMAAGKVKPIRSEKAGSGAEPKVRRLNRSWRGVSVEPVCGNCAGAGAGARRGQGTPPPRGDRFTRVRAGPRASCRSHGAFNAPGCRWRAARVEHRGPWWNTAPEFGRCSFVMHALHRAGCKSGVPAAVPRVLNSIPSGWRVGAGGDRGQELFAGLRGVCPAGK